MRNTFAKEITELACNDSRIVLLSGDIGNRLFDEYKKKCPSRFYNCGIAEANMTGMAAGMALSGLKPVTYTIASFNTCRCYEQIKIDICYQNLPVIIVGTGGGLSYATLGATHHSVEDVAIMRALPNMTVICPADSVELKLSLRAAVNHNAPVYIRIGKKGEPVIHKKDPVFQIGTPLTVKEGSDIAILSTGTVLGESLAAAEMLAHKGIHPEVISVHTVKPIDHSFLERVFKGFRLVACVEEHSCIGGLCSAISEWKADKSFNSRFLPMAVPDSFLLRTGDQNEAREAIGLTPECIFDKISRML